MSPKVPLGVRFMDMVHRSAVLGLVGISILGLGGIGINLYSNSDYSKMNRNKLTFQREQYEEARVKEDNNAMKEKSQ